MPHRQYDPAVIRHGIQEDRDFALELFGRDLIHIREIARQQILGDRELLRDMDAGREIHTEERDVVEARLWFCERLALYTGLELPPLVSDDGTQVLTELR